MALPPQGKDLAAFQQEDVQRRNYAAATIGNLEPGQAATQTTVGSAAVGTALGAAAGAAIGAAAGNAGAGAAIGGATGLVGGTVVGANNAAAGEYDLQARYNIAYTQCMYSRGDAVQYLPPGGYGYYDYGIAGYPWYDWSGPGFFGGGVFVFDRDHDFRLARLAPAPTPDRDARPPPEPNSSSHTKVTTTDFRSPKVDADAGFPYRSRFHSQAAICR